MHGASERRRSCKILFWKSGGKGHIKRYGIWYEIDRREVVRRAGGVVVFRLSSSRPGWVAVKIFTKRVS